MEEPASTDQEARPKKLHKKFEQFRQMVVPPTNACLFHIKI
jgi:hypothetical protein